ncbi:GNAT family N-acetyltransferase [Streptomyces nigra]|uniref:GNAT family N-acetyltransferase n=1 Tax=Streptomyces nigra TaxID=1827580 RepID=UPI0034530BB8
MSRPPRITETGLDDLDAAVALHRRCTPHTLWSRYHRAMSDPLTYLPALLGRPGSVHLAAWESPGRAVALAHLMPDGASAEAALLVEDSWQGHHLGTRLLHALSRRAVDAGCSTLYGLVLPGDARIAAILRHSPVPVHRRTEGGAVHVWVHTQELKATAVRQYPWHVTRRRAGHHRRTA